MIYMNSDSLNAQLGALVKVFDKFPRHVAKKHIGASMKRALKFAIPILKANTPKGGGTKASVRDGKPVKRVRGGALRRAATTQSKFIGKNESGFTIGTLGFKFGTESRKAIWQEFGTAGGVKPKLFMEKTFNQVKDQVAEHLARELALAVEKAAKDLAPGVDQHYRRK